MPSSSRLLIEAELQKTQHEKSTHGFAVYPVPPMKNNHIGSLLQQLERDREPALPPKALPSRPAEPAAMKWFQSIRQYLVVLLLGAACAWPFAADAAGYISYRGWLEDKSGTLTFPQVEAQAQAFVSFDGVLTRGYTASTYWIRLSIAPTTEAKLILRIRPAYIDHIELFDPMIQTGGNTTPLFSGDRHPRQQNDYQSINHGFTIQGSEYPRDVYLRLQSTSTILVYAEGLTVTQASSADHRQELYSSIYLGLLTAFLIWALLQWLAIKEPLIAVFLVKQAFVLAHAVAICGFLPMAFGEWLSAPAMDHITSALVLAYMLSGTVFMILLLREFKPVRWLWRLFAALLLIYLPMAILFWQEQIRLVLYINMIIGSVSAFGFLLVAVSARAWQDKLAPVPPLLPRWVLISFTVAILSTVYTSALPSVGSINGTEWTLNSPMFAGFFTSLLMTVLLSLRARNMEKNHQQDVLNLRLTEKIAENERAQRAEQERFLSMLTHELKTPLGVARISLGASRMSGTQRDRIERALLNINAIIDRCRMTDQIEHQRLLTRAEPCDLTILVDECIADCDDPERVKVLERNPSPLQSDLQLLAICVANLVDNALKYSPAASSVTVRVRPQTVAAVNGFVMAIANQIGPAGAPDAAQIFSKYYRSPGARSKSGSGLGLYLTSSIAQLLGAQLSYRVEGDQVEFSLWIPA